MVRLTVPPCAAVNRRTTEYQLDRMCVRSIGGRNRVVAGSLCGLPNAIVTRVPVSQRRLGLSTRQIGGIEGETATTLRQRA